MCASNSDPKLVAKDADYHWSKGERPGPLAGSPERAETAWVSLPRSLDQPIKAIALADR